MTKDMTSGAITPLLIKFTIPLVLGNLFQLTYNAADSIIVGKFVGEDALAAVGTSNPLMTLAILFINGMCLGAGILVSTAFGAGDTKLVERQVSTTAIAGTVFSLTFSALCVLLADPLLRLLQVPAAILPIAVNYLRIVFAGLIFTFFYNFLAATMRALGDSKSALYFLMISAVLNIGGDLFFVEALGWGSEGCALSTVLSEAACCLLCVVYIRYKVPVLQLGRRWLVYDGKLLRKTVSYGWASAMQAGHGAAGQNCGAGHREHHGRQRHGGFYRCLPHRRLRLHPAAEHRPRHDHPDGAEPGRGQDRPGTAGLPLRYAHRIRLCAVTYRCLPAVCRAHHPAVCRRPCCGGPWRAVLAHHLAVLSDARRHQRHSGLFSGAWAI